MFGDCERCQKIEEQIEKSTGRKVERRPLSERQAVFMRIAGVSAVLCAQCINGWDTFAGEHAPWREEEEAISLRIARLEIEGQSGDLSPDWERMQRERKAFFINIVRPVVRTYIAGGPLITAVDPAR